MTLPEWREEPIAKGHDRKSFDCGVPKLNQYLVKFARQNHDAGIAKTFVAVPVDDPERILGYYSLSAGEIDCEHVPKGALRRIGQYPVPVALLGRLAVNKSCGGLGLGGMLLLSAGERALAVSEQVGIRALAIEAKDERAATWYERFGAVRLLDQPLSLILPLATVATTIRALPP